MRIKISQQARNLHKSLVSGVGWTPSNVCFSTSDDGSVRRWNMDGESEGTLIDKLDTYVTAFRWLATVRGGSVTADLLVLGCSDGTIRLYNATGRHEKTEKAHTGAVTSVAWNLDGTSLVTGGEDGFVKQYSRSGNLRSKLAAVDRPIYAVLWSPDQSCVAYASGRFVTLKPLQVGAKVVKWAAHDGAVLSMDWSPLSNLIVTGGEDKKYKVWDSYGQCLFASKAAEFPITSVSWAPNGGYFAVGSFNSLSLCDRTGWTHSRSGCNSGSILAIDWSSDGTHLAGAGASGSVIFGQVVERKVEWKNWEVNLDEANHIQVFDVLSMDTSVAAASSASVDGTNGPTPTEELEFGHQVTDLSLGYDHLLVATTKQLYIYPINSFSTPHILELSGGPLSLLMQAPRCFLLVDKLRGLQILSYDGRLLSNPKLAASAVNPSFVHAGNVSVSNELLALIDRSNPTMIHVLDALTGKPLMVGAGSGVASVGVGSSGPLLVKHEIEVMEVGLSRASSSGSIANTGTERKLFFIDRNRDLWLYNLSQPSSAVKLATMVSSAMWHTSLDILAAVTDGNLIFWYYPAAVYIDRDLLPFTKSDSTGNTAGSDLLGVGVGGGGMMGVGCGVGGVGGAGGIQFGKAAIIQSFVDQRCVVRRADGSVLTASMSPYPALLYQFAASNSWSRCTRLCRSVAHDEASQKCLWSMLALMSIQSSALDTAELAFASLQFIDKLQFIQGVKRIPSIEGRNAELALYRRQAKIAEDILLQAGLIYRAIKMNMQLFKWNRALELALKHKSHIDTVLAYRQKYLESMSIAQETEPKFIQIRASVPTVDWEAINAKIEAEIRKEEERGTPYRSTIPMIGDEDPLAQIAKANNHGGGAMY